MSATESGRKSRSGGIVLAALWLVVFIGARLSLESVAIQARGLRIAIALSPILPTGLVLWFVAGAVRRMDELHRRVHLEALAIAFPLSILLLVVLGFLERAVELSRENWSYMHVWVFLPVIYIGSLGYTWSRYR